MNSVVHLYGSMDHGGAELRILDCLSHLQPLDEKHYIVALSGRRGALAPLFEDLGVSIVPRALDWGFARWFVRFLLRIRPTHVISNVQFASGYFLFLAFLGRVPHRIAYFHSTGDGKESTLARAVFRSVGKMLIRIFSTDVVAVSEAVLAETVESRAPMSARCSVLYPLIPAGRFPAAAESESTELRILVVGRLDRDKNPARALDVVAQVRAVAGQRVVSAQFAGSGTPAERRFLQSQAHALGIEDCIHLLGVRDDVPLLLASSDILLSTTLREGLPGAVLEATAAGIPCVVSSIKPNEEVARLLPSVVTVPLGATDAVWADVVVDLATARRSRMAPANIRRWFEQSPFAHRDDSAVMVPWH